MLPTYLARGDMPPKPRTNAQRQADFRARHPNYHRRYLRRKRMWAMGGAGAGFGATAAVSPTETTGVPAASDEGCAPTGC